MILKSPHIITTYTSSTMSLQACPKINTIFFFLLNGHKFRQEEEFASKVDTAKLKILLQKYTICQWEILVKFVIPPSLLAYCYSPPLSSFSF